MTKISPLLNSVSFQGQCWMVKVIMMATLLLNVFRSNLAHLLLVIKVVDLLIFKVKMVMEIKFVKTIETKLLCFDITWQNIPKMIWWTLLIFIGHYHIICSSEKNVTFCIGLVWLVNLPKINLECNFKTPE